MSLHESVVDAESWTNETSRMWSLGWAKAAQLSALDFDDPSSRNVPFVYAARDYFYSRVLRQHMSRKPETRELDGAKSYGTREFRETILGLLTLADEMIKPHHGMLLMGTLTSTRILTWRMSVTSTSITEEPNPTGIL